MKSHLPRFWSDLLISCQIWLTRDQPAPQRLLHGGWCHHSPLGWCQRDVCTQDTVRFPHLIHVFTSPGWPDWAFKVWGCCPFHLAICEAAQGLTVRPGPHCCGCAHQTRHVEDKASGQVWRRWMSGTLFRWRARFLYFLPQYLCQSSLHCVDYFPSHYWSTWFQKVLQFLDKDAQGDDSHLWISVPKLKWTSFFYYRCYFLDSIWWLWLVQREHWWLQCTAQVYGRFLWGRHSGELCV